MNKLTFYTVAALLIVSGCNKEEELDYKANEQTAIEQSGVVRTLSLSASMPEEPKGVSTRVALTQEDDKNIKLTWEENDQLQLCFVQGGIKVKQTVTVKNISTDGKKAGFDVDLPTEIDDGLFDLYGVYGGGGLSDSDPTMAILPVLSENTSSLTALSDGKHTMLRFSSKEINTANLQASVTFHHLGSLFCLTLKNMTAASLDNMGEARLASSTGGWAYNSAESGKSYNLVTNQFQDVETAGDYISLYTNGNIATNETLNFWGWYPPLPDVNWSELTLELYNKNDLLIGTSSNVKLAKTAPTMAGKCFYFYGVLNDAGLYFTDNSYTPPLTIGDLTLTGDLRHADSGTDFIGMVYTRAGNVYYNQAQLNGEWSGEVDLGTGTDPRIAIDGDNKPHLVYVDGGKIIYRVNAGTAFTDPVYIETNYAGSCSMPDIAVDGSGFAHITYTDTRGNIGAYTNHPDIMYAVSSSGAFEKTLMYDGYYDGWDSYSKYADYYSKGSRITLDGNGNYYIITHHQHYDRAVMGNYTDRNYYVKVKSATANGSTSGTYRYDREDIYDIAFDGANVIVFYKAGNTLTTAKLTVGVDNKITFEDTEAVAASITNTFSIPATLIALPGARVLGGISGGKVFMKYGTEEQFSDKSVKSATVVVATQCGGNIYTAYTGSADGIIRLIKRVE